MLDGVTDVEPEGTGVTVPTPWLIETDVAFVVDQVSEEGDPLATLVGPAVSVQVGGGSTVTIAVHVLVPPAPVTVPV